MPVSLHRIVLLFAFVAMLTSCSKKRQMEPPFIRSKEDPLVLLDTVIQTDFNSFKVSGMINQPWWTLNLHPERGILYSTDPNPSLDNSTRIKLPPTSKEDFLKVEQDLGELPDGKRFYIRFYFKADTNRVWYSRSMTVSTMTLKLYDLSNRISGRGVKASMRIFPYMNELPPNKLEIYLGTYKAEVNFKRIEQGNIEFVQFTVPENIPPGRYPIIGKLLNLTVLAVDSIEILQGKWSLLPEPPFNGRGRMAHFVWNNKGYIVGGTPAAFYAPVYKPIYRDVWQFDIATRIWTRKKDFPIDLHDAIAFNVNNRIFLMGGATSSSDGTHKKPLQQDIWEYDPVNDTWMNRGPHPQQKTARSQMTGTVLNNRIYVGTGSPHLQDSWPDRRVFSDWMMFNPATNTWTDLAPVPSGLRGGACFNDGENIYIVGGDNVNYIFYEKDVKRYNVRTNTWDFLPSIPNDKFRTQGAVAYIHNVPYIFGGINSTDNGGRNAIDLWRFNTVAPNWKQYMYYNSDQGLVVMPPGSASIIFPGAQPAVFPTANGFILYGGSSMFEGYGFSHTLAEYTVE